MGLITQLISEKHQKDQHEQDAKRQAYQNVVSDSRSPEAGGPTTEAKNYALSQLLGMTDVGKGKQGKDIHNMFSTLLGLGGGGLIGAAVGKMKGGGGGGGNGGGQAPSPPSSGGMQGAVGGGGPNLQGAVGESSQSSGGAQAPAQAQPQSPAQPPQQAQAPAPGGRPNSFYLSDADRQAAQDAAFKKQVDQAGMLEEKKAQIQRQQKSIEFAQNYTRAQNIAANSGGKIDLVHAFKMVGIPYDDRADGTVEVKDAVGPNGQLGTMIVDKTTAKPVGFIPTKQPEKYSGDLKERLDAKAILDDPKSTPTQKSAAQDTLKNLANKDKGVTVRINTSQANANEKSTKAKSAREDAEDTAEAVMNGLQPPDSQGLTRNGEWAHMKGIFARKGYNLVNAEKDWKAVSAHLRSMNSPQQLRINQNLDALEDTLPLVQQAYDDWKSTGLPGGFSDYNSLALAASARLPGEAGAKARNLQRIIGDASAEISGLYMGGNSPTEEALKLGQKQLNGSWNDKTFNEAMKSIKQQFQIRKNSVRNVKTQGLSEGSKYEDTPKSSSGDGKKPKDSLGIL